MIKNEKLSFGMRVLLYFASGLLGILLFIAVLATSIIADCQIIFDKGEIYDNVREVVIDILSSPAQAHKGTATPGAVGLRIAPLPRHTYAMPRREDASNVAEDLSQQLTDIFYEILAQELGEDVKITSEEFKEFIDQSTAKDFIADKAAGLVTDYFTDDITTTFSADEILTLIDENVELIESITGEPLPEDLNYKITNVVQNNEVIQTLDQEGLAGLLEINPEDIPGLSIADGQKFDIQGLLQTVRKATSTTNLYLGIAICVLLIMAIIAINLHQFSKGLRRAGYPLIMVGMGTFPCLMTGTIASMLDGIPGASVIVKLASRFALVYGIILGVGVALFIASIVFYFVLRSKGSIAIFGKKTPDAPVEEAAPEFVPIVEAEPETEMEPETETEPAPIVE